MYCNKLGNEMQRRNSKHSSMLTQEIILKRDILLLEIRLFQEEEKRTNCLWNLRVSLEVCGRNGDQVVLKSPEGVQYKRNSQHIKPLMTKSASDTKHDREHEAVAPGTEPNLKVPDKFRPGMTLTVTCAPHRSGRVRRRLKGLQLIMDYLEHFRNCLIVELWRYAHCATFVYRVQNVWLLELKSRHVFRVHQGSCLFSLGPFSSLFYLFFFLGKRKRLWFW